MSTAKQIESFESSLHQAAKLLVSANDRRVLLVEDTAAHAAIIRRSLDNKNWPTEHVTRGRDAIDAIKEDANRIVLLDLSLPDTDGISLISKLKNISSRVSVIVVTSTDDVSISVQAMQHGACNYVVKSDPEETASKLVAAVEKAWQKRIEEAEKELLDQTRLRDIVKAQRLEAIELVVRTVCQEVNNPLSGVMALSQLLKQNQELDNEMQELADDIEESAKQIRDAIDKLKNIDDIASEPESSTNEDPRQANA